jgi:broad specificity phosphatase PhoE
VTVYLIRHAKAGDRDTWRDDDRLRPLSGRGHRQARLLVDLLRDAKFDRVLSSPFVRCMETVVPIAGERGLPVEPVDALAEGARLDDALTLVRKHSTSGAILCMHGDVMPMLLDHYASVGVDIDNPRQWPKGCTWVLETDNTGEVVRVRYLDPPAD